MLKKGIDLHQWVFTAN